MGLLPTLRPEIPEGWTDLIEQDAAQQAPPMPEGWTPITEKEVMVQPPPIPEGWQRITKPIEGLDLPPLTRRGELPPLSERRMPGPVAAVIEPFEKLGATTAGAFSRGMAGFSASLDAMSDTVSKLTGLPKGGIFEGAKRYWSENAEYWNERAGKTDLTTEIMGEFLGGAAPGIAEFMLGPAYAGAVGFATEGPKGAVKEAARRSILGKILHAANMLKLAPRTFTMAGIGAGEAVGAGERDPREIAKATGVMAGLGATAGPSGRLGAREAVRDVFRPQKPVVRYPEGLDPFDIMIEAQRDVRVAEQAERVKQAKIAEQAERVKQAKIAEQARPAEAERPAEEVKEPIESWITKDVLIQTLDIMADEVRRGSVERGEGGWIVGTSYPPWFGAGKWSKKEFETLYDKIKTGKGLTEKQYARASELLDVATELAGKTPEVFQQAEIDADIQRMVSEGFDPVYNKIPAGYLHPGMQVIINGEKYTVKSWTKDGEILLEDGNKIKIDLFDMVEVEGVKDYDQEGRRQIQGGVEEGQEPGRPVQEPRKGGEPPPRSGIFQAPEEGAGPQEIIEPMAARQPLAKLDIDQYVKEAKRLADLKRSLMEFREARGPAPIEPQPWAGVDIQPYIREAAQAAELKKSLAEFRKSRGMEGPPEIEEPSSAIPLGIPSDYRPIPWTPETSSPIPEGKRRMEVIKELEKKLDVPIRIGRFQRKVRGEERAGIYKPHAKVIRLGRAGEVPVAVHESAHHFQELLGFDVELPAEVQAFAYEGAKNLNREGFAEFVRTYVVEPERAAEKAPEFFQEFERRLAEYPDVNDAMTLAKEAASIWKATDSVNKIGSVIAYGPERKRRTTLNELYTRAIEDIRPLKILVARAEERLGGPLAESENPYILAWLLRGAGRKYEQFLKLGQFRYTPEGVKIVGPPLREILKDVHRDGNLKLLDTYLLAKRASQDPRIREGFERQLSPADFDQAVRDLAPQFEEIAKQLYTYSDNLLNYLVDSGRINQKIADQIRSKNLFYAPLYRVMDAGVPHRLGTKHLDSIMNPIKRLKGSGRDVWSPTENIIKNTFAIINAAERNKVGRAILNLANIEGMGKYIEVIPFRKKIDKVNTKAALQRLAKSLEGIGTQLPSDRAIDYATMLKEILGHQKKVDKLLKLIENPKFIAEEGLEGIERAIEAAGLTPDDIFQVDKFLIGFSDIRRSGPDEAIFYRNGDPFLVTFGDPALAAAVKGSDAQSLEFAVSLLSKPAAWLRVGATMAPEFAGTNPFRDQWTAFVYSKYGYLPGYDVLRGVFHILKRDDLYQKYNMSGAAHASLVSMDRDYLAKTLDDLKKYNSKIGYLIEPIKHPVKFLQAISELMEEATRVGEFSNIYGEGRPSIIRKAVALKPRLERAGTDINALLRAGVEARDITLDFSRKGSDATIRALNGITAFFNAQLQGTDKMRRVFMDPKEGPRALFRTLAAITTPSILLWYAQKDDPYYQELPPWRKIMFWNIISHNEDGTLKHIWSLRKPFEVGLLFGSAVESALEWAYREDPEGMKTALEAVGSGLLPSFIPTAALPFAEWWANRSWFFDMPLVPRGREALPEWQQYREGTSEAIKLAAKGLYQVPGLKTVAVPAKIENLIRAWTGGTGRLVLEELDAVLEATGVAEETKTMPFDLVDVPGLRGFLSRFPTANAKSIERFYRVYDRTKRQWEGQKEEAGLRGEGLSVPRPLEVQKMDAAAKLLSQMRKTSIEIWGKKAATEEEKIQKRKQLHTIYFNMINLARGALGQPLLNFPELEAK